MKKKKLLKKLMILISTGTQKTSKLKKTVKMKFLKM